MHQHLVAKGLSTTAESLVQEANLNIAEKKSTPFTYISHCRVSMIKNLQCLLVLSPSYIYLFTNLHSTESILYC